MYSEKDNDRSSNSEDKPNSEANRGGGDLIAKGGGDVISRPAEPESETAPDKEGESIRTPASVDQK
jgi:hypothetical protein